MADVNEVILIGRLGAEPKISEMPNGRKVANFPLATTRYWKKQGERKSRTEWHHIAIFGDGLVGVIEKYTRKGSEIFLRGEISTNQYERDGQTHYFTRILVGREGKLQLMNDRRNGKPAADTDTEAPPSEEPGTDLESVMDEMDDEA